MTLFHRARRWSRKAKLFTAGFSTAATLISLLTYAHAYGLLPDDPPMRLTVADLNVSRVDIVPASDTLRALGDTVQLTVRVMDKHGTALLGAAPVWHSATPAVVSVDGDGTVIARGAGLGVITASVGTHVAVASLAVTPRVAHVHVVLDSALRIPEGEHRTVTARATDARGFVIDHRRVSWHITDTSVAAVDDSGVVTARTAGTTALTAAIDGVTGTADLAVTPSLGALHLLAGTDQHARAGAPLAAPVIVQLLSRRGTPVPGVALRFVGGENDGTASPARATTDASGRIRTTWTLGAAPGRQRLLVTGDGVDTVLAVYADADPTPSDVRVAVDGDTPSARAGQRLAHPLTVRVTDTLGVPLVGVHVAWTAEDGGEITARDARTDSGGLARADWTLGPRTGSQRALVRVGLSRAARPLPVRAIALAGAPSAITPLRGDEQKGTVGAALRQAITVRVVDAAGNGVAGTRVRWTAAHGALSDSVTTADSAGVARVEWTLGTTAGTQQLRAHAEGVKRALVLTASAVPARVANVSFVSPPGEGRTGRALAKPLRVQVTDAYGNPVAKVLVTFHAHAGVAAPARVMTDAYGLVTTHWTLGRQDGDQSLAAAAGAVKGELRVTARRK